MQTHSHPRVTGYISGVWAEVIEEAMARVDAGGSATVIVLPTGPAKPWRLTLGGKLIGNVESPEAAEALVRQVLPNARLAHSRDLIVGSRVQGGETFVFHYRLARSI